MTIGAKAKICQVSGLLVDISFNTGSSARDCRPRRLKLLLVILKNCGYVQL